ncbi:MAG: hypothetical protein ACK5PQ_04960 [Alphaproteobacteria bacterium]
MIKFVLIVVAFFSGFSWASLKEGVDLFNQGEYEKSRSVLGHESLNENWKAQLYLLASQGFDKKERSMPLLAALKAQVNKIDRADTKDGVAIQLVHAFWHLYSEETQPFISPTFVNIAPQRHPQESQHRGVSLLAAPDEGDSLLTTTGPAQPQYHTIQREGEAQVAPLAAAREIVSSSELISQLRDENFFPLADLFEGLPDEQKGVSILEKLAKENNPHAAYFLGVFYATYKNLEGDQEKSIQGQGWHYLMKAASLKCADSIRICNEVLGVSPEEGWANNCKMWCGWAPRGVSRVACGSDISQNWWQCGLGLCGYATRWSADRLFLNIFGVSRVTLRHLLMVASSTGMLLQLLEEQGFIDIFPEGQTAPGWLGAVGAIIAYLDSAKKR